MSHLLRLSVLASACVMGGGALLAVLPVDTKIAPHETAPIAAPPPHWEMPPLSAYHATLERPLFVRGRRPPKATAPDPVQAEAPLPASAPTLTVAGIVIAGERRFAWIHLKGAPEALGLSEGNQVAGWKVTSIHDHSVRFEKGGLAFEAQLRDFTDK